MTSSLEINGYRGMEHLAIEGLGRINLLVGTNNCGKTSILEAVSILESSGDLLRLWDILWRRGERTYRVVTPGAQGTPPRAIVEADLPHLFHGHEIHPGTRFSISAKNESPPRTVAFEIGELSSSEKIEGQDVDEEESPLPRLVLNISGDPPPALPRIVLSKGGGISSQRLAGRQPKADRPIQFISTESSSPDELLSAWNKISLKPEEELVLKALRSLDKDIERIALQARIPQVYWGPTARGGFMVKLQSSGQPVPIGSMGDGIWRMFALSMAIALCKGGTLLVDEIDTGLHYTVMSSMWKLVYDAARTFDVQVFATSHSQDCIWSLAQLAKHSESEHPITVQRIEAGKHTSVPYSGQEIALAADREIEVR